MKYIIVIAFLFFPIIGNSQDFNISKVKEFIKQKKYSQALSYLDSLEKYFDYNKKAVIKYYRAVCYYDTKEFSKSIYYCTSAIEEHTDNDSVLVGLYSTRMDNYRELGKFNLAIDDNIILLKLAPRHIAYYVNLSFLYGAINDRKKGITILEKALTIEPHDSYVYNNLAYSNSVIGNYENAIKHADEGLAFAKDSILIGCLLNNRGFAKLNLKLFDSALKDINESLKKYPTNSVAYYNKALVYIQLGDNENICNNLELAKAYGWIVPADKLILKYCMK